MFRRLAAAIPGLLLLMPQAIAATALDGAKLALPWALPFVGIILTIAAGPLLFKKVRLRHIVGNGGAVSPRR